MREEEVLRHEGRAVVHVRVGCFGYNKHVHGIAYVYVDVYICVYVFVYVFVHVDFVCMLVLVYSAEEEA